MSGPNRWIGADVPRGVAYDVRFEQLAATGVDVHGEATFVSSFSPASVLDAGCGTGRVAIELARRGVDVVGVDLDAAMLDEARRKAPDLTWVRADLSTLDLGRRFDLVVMAGNVLIFVAPGSEPAVVERLAAHLVAGGRLVAGFTLGSGFTLADYDAVAASAGLALETRFATWDRGPFVAGGDYAVSVHRAVSQ
jgi:SAM-dependent methyltransferase